jgi:hypothetical protein
MSSLARGPPVDKANTSDDVGLGDPSARREAESAARCGFRVF